MSSTKRLGINDIRCRLRTRTGCGASRRLAHQPVAPARARHSLTRTRCSPPSATLEQHQGLAIACPTRRLRVAGRLNSRGRASARRGVFEPILRCGRDPPPRPSGQRIHSAGAPATAFEAIRRRPGSSREGTVIASAPRQAEYSPGAYRGGASKKAGALNRSPRCLLNKVVGTPVAVNPRQGAVRARPALGARHTAMPRIWFRRRRMEAGT